MPVAFFFEGVEAHSDSDDHMPGTNGHDRAPADAFQNKETIDLVRAFYNLNDEPRRKLLDLAKAMSGEH